MKEYYSLNRVSEELGYSYNTIKNWVSRGILKPDRVTPIGRKQFTKEHIDNFKKSLEVHSNGTDRIDAED